MTQVGSLTRSSPQPQPQPVDSQKPKDGASGVTQDGKTVTQIQTGDSSKTSHSGGTEGIATDPKVASTIRDKATSPSSSPAPTLSRGASAMAQRILENAKSATQQPVTQEQALKAQNFARQVDALLSQSMDKASQTCVITKPDNSAQTLLDFLDANAVVPPEANKAALMDQIRREVVSILATPADTENTYIGKEALQAIQKEFAEFDGSPKSLENIGKHMEWLAAGVLDRLAARTQAQLDNGFDPGKAASITQNTLNASTKLNFAVVRSNNTISLDDIHTAKTLGMERLPEQLKELDRKHAAHGDKQRSVADGLRPSLQRLAALPDPPYTALRQLLDMGQNLTPSYSKDLMDKLADACEQQHKTGNADAAKKMEARIKEMFDEAMSGKARKADNLKQGRPGVDKPLESKQPEKKEPSVEGEVKKPSVEEKKPEPKGEPSKASLGQQRLDKLGDLPKAVLPLLDEVTDIAKDQPVFGEVLRNGLADICEQLQKNPDDATVKSALENLKEVIQHVHADLISWRKEE